MNDVVIRADNLTKRYRIGKVEPYKSIMEGVRESLSAPLRWMSRRGMKEEADEETIFWALRGVSFEVRQGEVVGIIGRNGAGKSTLLKILSRITEPTSGDAEIHGRVGSLLEVGTGFHPELTGRENIFLNGAILGMHRAEVQRKFDEMVAFAEVEQFIDTPVKRYSSGMYTRLAFAVAAHLEPEILLVDEVLAVGDVAFQKKCLGKMGDVAREGRTVLFISHNLAAVANLCQRAILLVNGRQWSEGPSQEVVREYVGLGRDMAGECVWDEPQSAPGNENIRLHAVRIVSDGETTADVDIQNEVRVEIEFWNCKPGAEIMTSIHLMDQMGVGVLASANMPSATLVRDEWFGKAHPTGLYRSCCVIPGSFLNQGRYHINALVLTDVVRVEAVANEVVSFMVHDTGEMRREYNGGWLGVVRPKLAWQTERLGD